ncbi:MAG: hypothetical protein ACXVEE_35295 [Polyangiales bacterium]
MRTLSSVEIRLHFVLALVSSSVACGGSTSPVVADDDAGSDLVETSVDSSARDDGSSATDTAALETALVDTAPPPSDAGVAPSPCVKSFALAHDLPHDADGALEGDLVGIDCPGDPDHLHLQVAVGESRYDIAIPVYDSMGGLPIGVLTEDVPAGSAPPGWSSAGFSYVSNLGVHSSAFTMLDKAGVTAKLKSELQYAHVSIHGKSYTDGSGVHDVHYRDGTHDGVVLLRGRGAGGTDHAIAVRYSSGTF